MRPTWRDQEADLELSTLCESPPPRPPSSRRLRPRTAALRLSLLGAGFARLPQKGGYTPPFTPRIAPQQRS